jgi:hypothetical protein
MSMSAAVSNFQVWRQRQQARQDHHRLDSHEDQHPLQTSNNEEEEVLTQQPSPPANNDTVPILVETVSEEEEDIENQRAPESPTETTPAVVTVRSRQTISLADLEEERELNRRRTNACVLVAVFLLFRLWIQAVATGEFGMLLLCLVGTSWTARFIRHTREREEELSRLISEYSENGGESEISRNDLRALSFQAQLALAIMESQRSMSQGGHGHPDGANSTPGVSDAAMEHWDRFQFSSAPGKKGSYGSVAQVYDLEKGKGGDDSSVEEAHCSICLGEYEEGETLVGLPCKHVYHADCVGSWCSNHIRCPLCNFDLESLATDSVADQEV